MTIGPRGEMDARECYVLRDEPCRECGGSGWMEGYCPCTFSGSGIGVTPVKVPLIDALRALGIDVPEPEEAPVMCPPKVMR